MRPLLVIAAVLLLAACTVLKSNPEDAARALLVKFQQKVYADTSNTELFGLFKTDQSKESILSAVQVLRDAEYPAVHCMANFTEALVFVDSLGTRVEVPVSFSVDTLSVQSTQASAFTIWIEPVKNEYFITKLDAEQFYRDFLSIKNEVSWELDEQELLAHHQRYFRVAQRLLETFDTVVWVATYDERDYYYVAKQGWKLGTFGEASMAVVDSVGQEIIPFGYPQLGNPGIVEDYIVETRSINGYGYFDIRGKKELIEPNYLVLIPYFKDGIAALGQQPDGQIGWFNMSYQFQLGFPSAEVEKAYKTLAYIPESMEIKFENYTLMEPPTEANFGSGTFITPSYLVSAGIFEESYQNLSMDGTSYRAYIDAVEESHSFLETIGESFHAFVTTLKTRYLEGRQEFYTNSTISFLDQDGNVTTSVPVSSAEVSFRKIDEGLIEMKSPFESNDEFYYASPFDIDLPQYEYLSLANGTITRLESNRFYPFTKFVKIDSSYLQGTFTCLNPETEEIDTQDFVPNHILQDMRNEIFASYGYIFDDPATQERFSAQKNYQGSFNSIEQVLQIMSDIDRHNVEFLDKILGPFQEKST